MSFLISKNILIDSIHDKIILSINENDKENNITKNSNKNNEDFN